MIRSELGISLSVESYGKKKLLKIAEMALPKRAYFPNYQRYRFQILIAQFEEFNQD